MGILSAIKRFEIHDGDGIRTTVFMKGCQLRCLWCHNPESLTCTPQIGYMAHKCIHCGQCSACCSANTMVNNQHQFDRSLCNTCSKCESICPGEAFILYGRQQSAEELLPFLLEDKGFYNESGGGVTLSGGEPLMQPAFCVELLHLLKEQGIHTALDTSAYATPDVIDKVLPYTDQLLLDIKAINEETHTRCTGMTNRIILENIRRLDAAGIPIEIRVPLIPDLNGQEIKVIGQYIHSLHNVRVIRLLPYHNHAMDKYRTLDMPYLLPDTSVPTEEFINQCMETLSTTGLTVLSGKTQ